MHRVEVPHIDGLHQLQRTSEHLLPEPRVDGEHGVMQPRVLGTDVAEDGEEEFLHLVGRHFHTVVVRLGEIPVVAVARVEYLGAISEDGHGTHPHIGGTVGVEGEMGCLHLLAKSQHRQGLGGVYATAFHRVVGRQQMPLLAVAAQLHYLGVEMVLMKMRDNEIHRPTLPASFFQQTVQQSFGVFPIIVDNQKIGASEHEAAVVDVGNRHAEP